MSVQAGHPLPAARHRHAEGDAPAARAEVGGQLRGGRGRRRDAEAREQEREQKEEEAAALPVGTNKKREGLEPPVARPTPGSHPHGRRPEEAEAPSRQKGAAGKWWRAPKAPGPAGSRPSVLASRSAGR